MRKTFKGSVELIFVALIVVIALILVIFNRWVKKEIDVAVLQNPLPNALAMRPSQPLAQSQEMPLLTGEVTRRSFVQRGADYIDHYFYAQNQQIAHLKETNEGVEFVSGKVPDGKIKYFDEYKKTHGEEYYRYGKKHGIQKEYYDDGRLKSEEEYQYGVLITQKDYYSNGTLRFEVDYHDALNLSDKKEAGVGKLYFQNGFLKYEWNLTKTNKGGFKKSYNQDGTLRAASYFDEKGNLIKTETPALGE